MCLQAFMENGDEILIPAPDYPLWTAAVTLTGGKPVHYLCDEDENWWPDMADVEAKITPRTKGIVIINPNNPTGAVYPRHILEQFAALARKHDLVLFSDEIYEKIRYGDAQHIHTASVAEDVCCLTFSGLSKAYRMPGYRAGWVAVTGPLTATAAYREGLELLASLRLCANVPAQHAIQTCLGGYQSIEALIRPGGRLREQRDLAWKLLTAIPGVSCVPAAGAMYLFPRLDPELYPIASDEKFVLRPAAGTEDPGLARHGLQLAHAGPLPVRDPAVRGGHRGSGAPDLHVPGRLPEPPRGLTQLSRSSCRFERSQRPELRLSWVGTAESVTLSASYPTSLM